MKNKLIISLMLVFLFTSIYTNASEQNIFDYLRKIDANYAVVLGVNGKSGDSFAAADIIVSLKKNFNLDIEPVIESPSVENTNKILIGHPCDNSLIKLSCEEWPYDPGTALIKIMENDLVIAGTTIEDTRRAAKVIANYKQFPQLKQYKEVLVYGDTLKLEDITLDVVKKESDFICGDNICAVGEKLFCPADCKQTSCFKLCQENGFIGASCKDPPGNLNLPFCSEDETNQGPGYCADEKVCCCKKETISEKENNEQDQEINKEQKENLSIFQIVWRWLKELFSTIF